MDGFDLESKLKIELGFWLDSPEQNEAQAPVCSIHKIEWITFTLSGLNWSGRE